MNPFVERHQDKIAGALLFWPGCHHRNPSWYRLFQRYSEVPQLPQDPAVRLPWWAEPLREELCNHAEQLAIEAGIEIEFIRPHHAFRKEARIMAIIAERGTHPGLVHVFSALESCSAYRPWHDMGKGHTLLKPMSGKCLHYYFYFIDGAFGLCYLRVPAWAPFSLQVYFNGHHWQVQQL